MALDVFGKTIVGAGIFLSVCGVLNFGNAMGKTFNNAAEYDRAETCEEKIKKEESCTMIDYKLVVDKKDNDSAKKSGIVDVLVGTSLFAYGVSRRQK